jgi:glycosyltransferase involved in cell wall biosynthesis
MVYNIFRRKEKSLYRISDHIGCMSPANVEYVLANNKDVNASKVHVCPNSITPLPLNNRTEDRNAIKEKYGIPTNTKVFIYGGNLGKPQCVPFIIECLKLNQNKDDRYFLICGGGTDEHLLKEYIKEQCPNNVKLMDMLPKDEYDNILSACDVGLIFLDYRFTIPNFPSRLLSYMEHGLPVLACTDPNTDVGKVIEESGFGWRCASNDSERVTLLVDEICKQDTNEIGARARKHLEENYLASQSAKIIMDRVSI